MMFEGEALPVEVDEVIDGKYVIERPVGVGGMAAVLAARHRRLDELVAVKVLLPRFARNPEIVARFEREGRAAARIKSQHVARVFDVGNLPNNGPYIVMELLAGEDLSAVIKRGRVAPVDAVRYVLDACEAIEEAHGLGIVHRDLKPGNLFCVAAAGSRRPILKVLDFGISKAAHLDKLSTETGARMGTPWYMAPEQMRSAKLADARSDIWALGVILYELLTSQLPFDGDELPELMIKVLQDVPVPVKALVPTTPPELDAVVARCLSKDPGGRFQNVGELVAALRQALDRASGDGTPAQIPVAPRPFDPVSPNAPTHVGPGGTTILPERTEIGLPAGAFGEPVAPAAPARKRSPIPFAIGGIGLLGAAGIAVALSRTASEPGLPRVASVVPSIQSVVQPSAGLRVREHAVQKNVRLFVDGTERGTLPQELLDLAPGPHTLKYVGGERLDSVESRVDIKPNEMLNLLPPTLLVKKGKVSFRLETAGAKVFLVSGPSGTPSVTTRKVLDSFPIAVEFDPRESWRVEAKLAGMEDLTIPINFDDGEAEKTIAISLKPRGAVATPPKELDAGAFDQAGIERVISAHRSEVKRACWEKLSLDQKTANVTVTVSVDTEGKATRASATGDDAAVTKCIEDQVRKWTFPPPATPSTVNIPFKFVRT